MNEQLLHDLIAIRDAALRAVDPALALSNLVYYEPALSEKQGLLHIGHTIWDLTTINHLYLVAVGKAASPMAQAMCTILGDYLDAGILVTKYGHTTGYHFPDAIKVYEAGHPIPDESGVTGANAVAQFLSGLQVNDCVILLLSGGASAILPLPFEGITLSDLQALTTALLQVGANIQEINCLRKHLEKLKGGNLARLAAPARLISLILSDVVGDHLDVIASGPTVPDPTTFLDAWQILDHYQMLGNIPAGIEQTLQRGIRGLIPETPKPGETFFDQVDNIIIGSNRLASQAAIQRAKQLGYHAALISTYLEGEAREVAKVIAACAKEIRSSGNPVPVPACLIFGGETTVTVRGPGLGGRNQELALSAAMALEDIPGVVLMALATDGTDGPTDVAGAIISGDTVPHARQLHFDPRSCLEMNDSYHLLQATGSLMRTGPTGTNVCDLCILLVSKSLT